MGGTKTLNFGVGSSFQIRGNGFPRQSNIHHGAHLASTAPFTMHRHVVVGKPYIRVSGQLPSNERRHFPAMAVASENSDLFWRRSTRKTRHWRHLLFPRNSGMAACPRLLTPPCDNNRRIVSPMMIVKSMIGASNNHSKLIRTRLPDSERPAMNSDPGHSHRLSHRLYRPSLPSTRAIDDSFPFRSHPRPISAIPKSP